MKEIPPFMDAFTYSESDDVISFFCFVDIISMRDANEVCESGPEDSRLHNNGVSDLYFFFYPVENLSRDTSSITCWQRVPFILPTQIGSHEKHISADDINDQSICIISTSILQL